MLTAFRGQPAALRMITSVGLTFSCEHGEKVGCVVSHNCPSAGGAHLHLCGNCASHHGRLLQAVDLPGAQPQEPCCCCDPQEHGQALALQFPPVSQLAPRLGTVLAAVALHCPGLELADCHGCAVHETILPSLQMLTSSSANLVTAGSLPTWAVQSLYVLNKACTCVPCCAIKLVICA